MTATMKKTSLAQYVCDVCGLQFNTEAELREHKRIKHATGQYKCEVCGQVFDTEAQLREHTRLDHPELQKIFLDP